MASGDASLAGAEFTFRYYDGQYATAAEAEASGAPTRTWAFKTNEKGRIRIMDESLKVSGDDLFYNSMGQITLPIGTLLIQETKAPEGYLIDPTVYVRNITPDGTLEAVNSYNAPTVSEQVVTGRIQIVKHTDTGTTKVETPEVGATFNIYLASAGSYDAAPANAKAQLTIDKDGFAVSPDLPYGLYTVEQTSGWEGSRLMEPFTVKIDENGKTYSYIINNERFYSYLKVVKVDAITGEAIPAAGIGFQIIDPQGQKLEWWGADTWYTDGSGVMKLPCELEYGRGYTYAGLPYEGFCCAYSHGAAMANRDGPIPKGALIFSGVIPGTGKVYENDHRSGAFCASCGHYAGHVAIYVGDGYVAGSQVPYLQSIDVWISIYGYGGWSKR